MSQSYTVNCYDLDAEVLVNLQAIEDNFACLKTNFSGANDTLLSSIKEAGLRFFDTTKAMMKVRNSTNTAWLAKMSGDASSKIWAYKNSAPDGMVVDSGVADCIIALKGGAQAYNANGGNLAGTWTQPDCTLDVTQIAAHTHGSGGAHTHSVVGLYYSAWSTGTPGGSQFLFSGSSFDTDSAGTHEHANFGGGGAHNHGTAFRLAAAVGTLQYLDI